MIYNNSQKFNVNKSIKIIQYAIQYQITKIIIILQYYEIWWITQVFCSHVYFHLCFKDNRCFPIHGFDILMRYI